MKKYLLFILFLLLINSVFAYSTVTNEYLFESKHQYTVYYPKVNYQPNEPLYGMFSVTTDNSLDYETNSESELFKSLNENELIFGGIRDYSYGPLLNVENFDEDLDYFRQTGLDYFWSSINFWSNARYRTLPLVEYLPINPNYDPSTAEIPFSIPIPWQIESVIVDCGNGDSSYYIEPFTPDGDQSRYGLLENPPNIIETPFSCVYDQTGQQYNQTITVTYRKNRFYVLNEYFVDPIYKDDAFTSYMANPYQIGLPNGDKCYIGESFFTKVNNQDINKIFADIPDDFVLNDEFCQRDYVIELPALAENYSSSDFFIDINVTTDTSGEIIPSTERGDGEVLDYERFIAKQIKYDELRTNIKDKNKVFEILTDISEMIFGLILILFYVIELYIFIYVIIKWIPQIINIIVEFIRSFRGK